MKLKFTIPIVLVVMLSGWLVTSNLVNTNSELAGLNSSEEMGEEERKETLAKHYQEWMFELKKNPVTNQLSFDDVYEGRSQVKALLANASSRGGGLGLEWETMGPNNVGGRTRAIVIDPNNPNTMWAAGISGGVFISTDGSSSWTPSPGNETLGSLLVGAMDIASNGDLYIGTGEDNTGFFDGTSSFTHAFTGDGMFKSTDGGQSWTALAATTPTPGTIGTTSGIDWAYVYRVATHPSNADEVVAGHNGGLEYSTDGGATWNFCNTVAIGAMDDNRAEDVIWDDEGYLHVIYGNRYYRSVDASDPYTLDLYGEGLPTAAISRVVIAVAPSDNNYVYAYVANSSEELEGVYRSTDKGINFSVISPEASSVFNPPGSQGDWNLCIAVNPSDADRIYIGGQLDSWTWRASTGAWTSMTFSGYGESSPKYIHADHHTIVFHPTDPNIMFVGSDGGVSRTTNALDIYPDFATRNKGFDITQFNGVSVGFYGEALAGSQDNGSQYVNFLGNSALEATEIVGGDGGKGEISKIRPEYLFAAFADFSSGTNGAALRRSVNGGSTSGTMFDPNIDNDGNGTADTGGEFIAEFRLWENWELYETFKEVLESGTVEYPAGSGTFYEVGDIVNYEGRDIELTRSGISESRFALASGSNVWVTNGALFNSTTNPTWFKIQTGATFGIPSAFTFSADGDELFVGTSSGRLYRFSGLLNATWEYDEDEDFDPATAGITEYLYTNNFGSRITGLDVADDDSNILVVSRGGYGVSDNVYYTDNALDNDGAVFTSISGGLPNIPVYDAMIHYYDNNWILVGTEFGVWSYNVAAGGDWVQESSVIGNVPTMELREDWIRDTDCRAIYIGTHGKGYYRATNLAPGDCNFAKTNDVASESGPIQEEIIAGIVVAPNPAYDVTTISLTLKEAKELNISIYNMSGVQVMNLGTGIYPAGITNVTADVKDLMPGHYLVVVSTADGVVSRKLTVL